MENDNISESGKVFHDEIPKKNKGMEEAIYNIIVSLV